ncbi:extracellular solute-binding protein [Aquibacillus koreensis]|uniref:Extracellular solute-binding protein n=1 Tax=Aquibacillus koreensis TaxID=279446 RepID=A0A9X4AJA0_9BACI|nr:extracellular solute-binding protein [Aquibacillus koreensis]MCT2537206.1 extracellular solute-binding protein [Aquibacillus koreensis]MDC3421554.1 extracellular solute-binding protein [Aquibacillus koreensis]
MKKWFLLVVLLGLMLFVVACSDDSSSSDSDGNAGNNSDGETNTDNGGSGDSDSGGDPVELDFWVFGNAGYDVLAEEYKKDNPNVTININEGEMADQHNNLFTSISGGSGAPDIAMVEVSEIAKFMEASDQFYNLNDYGAADVGGNFLEWKWQQAQSVDGSFQIGLPTDIGPTTMFYRTDVMEEAGLPTDRDELAAELDTWDAYYEAAKTIKDATDKPIADAPKLVFNALRDQEEQQYFDEEGNLIIDNVKEAYDYTTKMIGEGLIGQNSLWTPEWGSAMADGSYATMPGAPGWMVGNVKGNAPDASGLWDIASIPEGAGNWGGSFLTVPAESEHPQEAYDFIAWLTAPEQQLKAFHEKGLFPSAPDVYENEEFLATTDEYFNGAPTAAIFAEAAKSVTPVYMGVNYSIVDTELDTAITNVAVEGADPQDEWDAAVERIETQLERQ